eukprot:COSAG01_NODE_110_length_25904_cov_154.158806_6_plen_46_part_00
MKSGATLLAKNCNVRKNKLQGVWIYEGGQGTLEHVRPSSPAALPC